MQSILIVTADAAAGELLRLMLEQTGIYQTRLVQGGREALTIFPHQNFDAAIFDASLKKPSTDLVEHLLLEKKPDLQTYIIHFSKKGNGDSSDAPELASGETPGRFQPLVSVIRTFLQTDSANIPPVRSQPQASVPENPKSDPWLQDRTRTTKILEAFISETKSNGALVIETGRVFASAGELDQISLGVIASTVRLHQDANQAMDLARFIRLPNNHRYLLYAMPLGSCSLVVVEDILSSFSRSRIQTNQLARVLRELPELGTPEPTGELTTPAAASQLPMETGEKPAEVSVGGSEVGFELDEDTALNLSQLLSSMPSPDPTKGVHPSSSEWKAEPDQNQVQIPSGVPATIAQADAVTPSAPVVQFPGSSSQLSQALPSDEDLEPTQPVQIQQPPETLTPTAVMEGYDQFEFNQLVYSCVLVSRLPEHALPGELAKRLQQWLPQLCIAFGWRFESMAIQQNHLLWSIRVPPTVAPVKVIQTIRQHTSQRIFSEFPSIQYQNPSGDFWAPGYMIVSGHAPAPALIQYFIRQTRHRQGLPV